MNGYICFYNGKRIEVYASTSFAAHTIAVKAFKVTPKNSYKVHVHLAVEEKNGEIVKHLPLF